MAVTSSPPEYHLSKYQSYIANIFGVLIILLLGWYLYNNQAVFGTLRNISWQQVVWIVLLDTASFVIGSLLNLSLISRFDSRVTFLDCLLLQYVNNLLNRLLPTIGGGAAFRAVYLKKKYQFPYSQFVSTVAGFYVISFFSVSLIGILCLFAIYVHLRVFNWVIFLAFCSLLLACLFIMLFSPQFPESNNRIFRILKSIIEGWNVIKRKPKLIMIYAFLSILLLLAGALETSISYQALGLQTDLIAMLFLSTLGLIVAFLSFTPDGIGVKEGIYVLSADLVQISNAILVLGSLILRAISFLTSFTVGAISYWLLMRELRLER